MPYALDVAAHLAASTGHRLLNEHLEDFSVFARHVAAGAAEAARLLE